VRAAAASAVSELVLQHPSGIVQEFPRMRRKYVPSVQGGTQQVMDRSGEHLAVLVREAPEIRQAAGRPDVLYPSEPRSASSASMESYTFPSGASPPGRDGYLAS